MSDAENSSEQEQEKQEELDETLNIKSVIAESQNQWELIRAPLREQLKLSRNVLWSEAVKARYHAAKEAPLFKPIQSTARMANLGSLTNLPKPSTDINKRICVVYGDIFCLKTDAYILPLDDSETCARAASLAGEEL